MLGAAALEAVPNPAQSRTLTLVADGSGQAFAQGLVEQNKNVQKWRRIQLQQRRKKKAGAE